MEVYGQGFLFTSGRCKRSKLARLQRTRVNRGRGAHFEMRFRFWWDKTSHEWRYFIAVAIIAANILWNVYSQGYCLEMELSLLTRHTVRCASRYLTWHLVWRQHLYNPAKRHLWRSGISAIKKDCSNKIGLDSIPAANTLLFFNKTNLPLWKEDPEVSCAVSRLWNKPYKRLVPSADRK